jgi:flavin-dependent dehydrogenase
LIGIAGTTSRAEEDVVAPQTALDFDVVIVGGGPAGSTVGSLLKKYEPALRVLILEKEKFPREHVGESLLPPIGSILNEMGVWDKVEAANFPIKIGATYRWGGSDKLWDFEFLPPAKFKDEPRPARYVGQRRATAFQVDRAVYDDILLRHAESLGCVVMEEMKVTGVEMEGDRLLSVSAEPSSGGAGRRLTAAHFVDASGHTGVLRRAIGIGITVPTRLKNVAMWDYWENAEWAVKIGVGGTRVQIMSMKHGWIWFIPLGPTRTSIGLVCPADYYKASARRPEDLYAEAVHAEPRIADLIAGATREGVVRTTKDWSYLADRLTGENWFLVGESAGFADPILSAGLTLAHTGAREVAHVILETRRGAHDQRWMRANYNEQNRARISQYIRFADYWYSANGQFTDLQAYTSEIAKEAGLRLDAREAFRWLSFGGLSTEDWLLPGLATLDVAAVKETIKILSGTDDVAWEINNFNIVKLNLVGAKRDFVPVCSNGRILKIEAYRRAGKILPASGLFGAVTEVLKRESGLPAIAAALHARAVSGPARTFGMSPASFFQQAQATLETMLMEGWATGRMDKAKPTTRFAHATAADLNIHWNYDDQIQDRRRASGASREPEHRK